MITQQYPASPVRISGKILDYETQVARGSLSEHDGDPHDFGFAHPWIEQASFVARLTALAASGLQADDLFKIGIEIELRDGGWHGLIAFPAWKINAGEALASVTGNVNRDWQAMLIGEEPTEAAPQALGNRLTLAAGADDNSGASILQMPICGRIRPVVFGRLAGAGFVTTRAEVWIEGYALPQGMNYGA